MSYKSEINELLNRYIKENRDGKITIDRKGLIKEIRDREIKLATGFYLHKNFNLTITNLSSNSYFYKSRFGGNKHILNYIEARQKRNMERKERENHRYVLNQFLSWESGRGN